jgi:hypothetical protein
LCFRLILNVIKHIISVQQSLTKEEQAEFWNLNNQSQSAMFAKGQVYEMSFIAYKGFDYRMTVCTDIVGGDKSSV